MGHGQGTPMNRPTAPRALRDAIKAMLVETLMLQRTVAEIADAQPLFGPEGLDLDSVDALQLVVALDKGHGLKISDAEVAKQALQNVTSMADAVLAHQAKR